MPLMLRQKTTGDMYVYTEIMARRDDMELVDIPDIGPKLEPANTTESKKPLKVQYKITKGNV